MRFTGSFLFIRICWNSFNFFVVWLYNFSSHVIAESYIILGKYFSIFTTKCRRIPNIIFFLIHDAFYTHISICRYSTIYSHDISFVKIFDSFLPVIMLSTRRFKSSVLLGIHTLLQKYQECYNFIFLINSSFVLHYVFFLKYLCISKTSLVSIGLKSRERNFTLVFNPVLLFFVLFCFLFFLFFFHFINCKIFWNIA